MKLTHCLPKFLVLVPEATPTTKDNSRTAQFAIGLGVSLPLACAVLTVVGVIIGVLICVKRSSKRYIM